MSYLLSVAGASSEVTKGQGERLDRLSAAAQDLGIAERPMRAKSRQRSGVRDEIRTGLLAGHGCGGCDPSQGVGPESPSAPRNQP